MKKIRYLPFGYTIRNGQTVIDQQEAETVRGIFTAYIHGASLKEIAEQMSKTGPTYDTGKSWNKNMVARILESPKYTGVDNYPKLGYKKTVSKMTNIKTKIKIMARNNKLIYYIYNFLSIFFSTFDS